MGEARQTMLFYRPAFGFASARENIGPLAKRETCDRIGGS
jgi:hypothetical protein